MATTYTLISSVTVGSGGAATIDFTSIPGTYTDLVLKLSSRQSTAQVYGIIDLSINGTSTNESYRMIEGNGSSASSNNGSYIYVGAAVGANATANTFSNFELYFANYASSNNKSISIDGVGENNATTAYANLQAALWANSAAITSISLESNFVQYSTAYLYGISNA
jgi:hypothetical protein